MGNIAGDPDIGAVVGDAEAPGIENHLVLVSPNQFAKARILWICSSTVAEMKSLTIA